MSTVLQSKPVAADNLAEKLGFQQKLQTVTNKIHATKNIDEIILELSQELCNLFNADRLTIYLFHWGVWAEVERIDAAVRRIRLPLAYSDRVYDLRGHIDLVRKQLYARSVPPEDARAAAE